MTSSPAKPLRVLILGGTADANRLAEAVANDPRIDAVLSYAGRTENPTPPPISWRLGGFGGIDGLDHRSGVAGTQSVCQGTSATALESTSGLDEPSGHDHGFFTPAVCRLGNV